jgi:hypothetical protein
MADEDPGRLKGAQRRLTDHCVLLTVYFGAEAYSARDKTAQAPDVRVVVVIYNKSGGGCLIRRLLVLIFFVERLGLGCRYGINNIFLRRRAHTSAQTMIWTILPRRRSLSSTLSEASTDMKQ